MSSTPSEKGIGRLAYQFTDSTKFIAFLEAFLAQFDDLEVSKEQLLTERYLDTSEGVQLDGIGEILGYPRPEVSGSPATDELYRLLLKAKTKINTTNMTVDETTEIISLAFSGATVQYVLPAVLQPAYFINMLIDPSLHFIFTIFPLLICIGDIAYIYYDDENTFSFAEDPTGKGFGFVGTPAVGGRFAFVISP